MNHFQTMRFLKKLEKIGTKLGLERVEEFLALIGNPQLNFKSVHIAGTNGKGSTAAMIESILKEAGYKTGLYTSPHLVQVNERIRVNGLDIGNEAFTKLASELRNKMEKSRIELTYFEFLTALAFKHFADSKVETAVIETGLGGRLDATNVVMPLLSIITNVEKEHQEFLGKTLEEIAFEKAGIIKQGIPAITFEEKKEVLEVFKKIASEKKSELVLVKENCDGRLALQGLFQKKNAALAVEAARQLKKQGLGISGKAVDNGLEFADWPGRFQIVQRNPTVVLDCAHNPAGAKALAKAFEEAFPSKRALLVIGVSSGKNLEEMAKEIASLSEKVFVTGAKVRAMGLEKIAKGFEGLGIGAGGTEGVCKAVDGSGKSVEVVPGVANAVRRAIKEAGKEGVVLVCGSCFVVGEAVEFFER